jgi:hypothetical protein
MRGLGRGGTALSVAGWLLVAALGVVWLAQPWWRDVGRLLTVPGWRWVPILITALGVAGAGWRASRRWRRGGLFGQQPAAERVPLVVHVAVLLLVAVGVAVGVGIGLWSLLGRPGSAGTPGPGGTPGWTVRNTFEVVKIALAVVAGIGGVVALTVAYRKQGHAEAAERRENTKLFNERFGKASEQLGSDRAAVRLAGVYAMAGLADDWVAGRRTCIDVLCAYLRMPYTPPADLTPATPDPEGPEEPSAAAHHPSAGRAARSRLFSSRRRASSPTVLPAAANSPTPEIPPSDPVADRAAREEQQVRRTILDLIGAHLQPDDPDRDIEPRWHGHRFDLRGATIDGGDLAGITTPAGTTIILTNTTFAGTVSFLGARFAGGTVDFSGATFASGAVSFFGATFASGAVSFSGATFADGTMSFFGATFAGGTADFSQAAFTGGTVYFFDATFADGIVSFSSATFANATVSFADAKFVGGVIDLSNPQRWDRPPVGVDETTTGVLWPTAEHLRDLNP